MNKKDCIIVDLEGTLTNCRHRLKHIKNKDYDKWNKLFLKDTINEAMVADIKRWIEFEKKIILCTAKSVNDSEEIINWLQKNLLFDLFDCFYFRAEYDERSSVEVKKEMMLKIVQKNNIIKAYDDRIEIIELYRKWNIDAVYVPNNNKTPDEILENAAKLFKKKNLEYGTSYKSFGQIMIRFFPNGLRLKTEKDFTRFAILNILIAKTDRYSKNFLTGHQDSLADISVYAAMLQEIDNE